LFFLFTLGCCFDPTFGTMASVLSAWLTLSCCTTSVQEKEVVIPGKEMTRGDLDLVIEVPHAMFDVQKQPSLVSLGEDSMPSCTLEPGSTPLSDAFRSNTSTEAPSCCGDAETDSTSRCSSSDVEDCSPSSSPVTGRSLRDRRALPALKVQTRYHQAKQGHMHQTSIWTLKDIGAGRSRNP